MTLLGHGDHVHDYSGKAMTDILLSRLGDHEVQRQALAMKNLGLWLFVETVGEVMRLKVAWDSTSGVAPHSLAPGVAVAPGLPSCNWV